MDFLKYKCDSCGGRHEVMYSSLGVRRIVHVMGKNKIVYDAFVYGTGGSSTNGPDGFYCAGCHHPLIADDGTVLDNVFVLMRLLHVQNR